MNKSDAQHTNQLTEEAIINELNEIYKIVLPPSNNAKYNKLMMDDANSNEEERNLFMKSSVENSIISQTGSNTSSVKKEDYVTLVKR